ANNLLDLDADNDRLDDGDEFQSTHTRPHDPDTDDDGLSDWQELVQYGGRFDPTQADTDGDGTGDAEEAAILNDPNADFDQDGIANGAEAGYGTDPARPDTDCDGFNDGAERTYWGAAWNTGSNRLLNPDVDGDSLKDGVEAGTVGTSREVVYRTDPARWDSDADGLGDSEEDTNKVTVTCSTGTSQQSAASPGGGSAPIPGLSFPLVVNQPLVARTLDPRMTYADPLGPLYRVDEESHAYLLGAYGVPLYPDTTQGSWTWPALAPTQMSASSSTGAGLTHPTRWDTDADGLGDGAEIQIYGTNPVGAGACDTDADGLGDALELRIPGSTTNPNDPCTHRDADASSGTNPLMADTDGDGYGDGSEDGNKNGRLDLVPFGGGYCGLAGSESNPLDLDSDEDGLSDREESQQPTGAATPRIFCFDSDGDGIGDGMELGRTTGVAATAVAPGTDPRFMSVGTLSVPTFNPQWSGAVLNPLDPDVDDDGIPDGLEDLDFDGVFGPSDYNPSLGRGETSPTNAD
ncbi:MAG: hypothetical protein ACRDHK_10260, partial [Actinomycetota bacterium]